MSVLLILAIIALLAFVVSMVPNMPAQPLLAVGGILLSIALIVMGAGVH